MGRQQQFVLVTVVLLALGLLMVYSSSITSRPTDHEQVYFGRQLLFLAVAGVVAACAAAVPARLWRALAPLLFGITLALLVVTMLPGIGLTVNGARRWMRIGGWTFQPSELAKITLPLLVARTICGPSPPFLKDLVRVGLPTAAVALIVIQQPDLGTTLFLAASAGLTLFYAGWPARRFLLAIGLTAPLLAGVVVLRPYQLKRIEGFAQAWLGEDEAPYQVRQSLTSLGAGGPLGRGIGRGTQKLSFLPEGHTDFVFAVIGEELGLAGTLGVIVLWSGFYITGARLLRRLPPAGFESVVGHTLLTSLVLQGAINIAVVVALLPPKGISLPLISYGGSNLLVSLLTVGIVLSLAREKRDTEDTTESPAACAVRLQASEPTTRAGSLAGVVDSRL